MRHGLEGGSYDHRTGRRRFPGHIACSSASRSEIVVPVIWEDKVIAVLDIDSDKLDSFNETDQIFLEKIVELLPHQ